VSGTREGPVAGFQYRCSTGHWVTSRKSDLVDTACPALWHSELSTVSAPCSGTLRESMVDGEEAAAEIERLRAAGDALAEVVDEWARATPAALVAWQEARRER